jgi:hypothetical protein
MLPDYSWFFVVLPVLHGSFLFFVVLSGSSWIFMDLHGSSDSSDSSVGSALLFFFWFLMFFFSMVFTVFLSLVLLVMFCCGSCCSLWKNIIASCAATKIFQLERLFFMLTQSSLRFFPVEILRNSRIVWNSPRSIPF